MLSVFYSSSNGYIIHLKFAQETSGEAKQSWGPVCFSETRFTLTENWSRTHRICYTIVPIVFN